MRSAVLGKVREYKWELWLFFGVGVVVSIVGSLVQIAVGFFIYGNYGWSHLPFFIASFAVLAISYSWVRRLQRPMLKLMWQYSLAGGVLSIAFGVIMAVIHETFYQESPWSNVLYMSLLGLVQFVVGLAILVWFARQASRDGFRKALVLIGIAASSGVSILEVFGYGVRFLTGFESGQFGFLLATIPLALLPVWALKRVDSGKRMPIKGIAVLFTAAWLSWVLSFLGSNYEPGVGLIAFAVSVTAVRVVLYAIAIGVAYFGRVRVPEDESPPDGPSDRGTLLYG